MNKKQTILVIGGAGFIGSHLVNYLWPKHNVIVFDCTPIPPLGNKNVKAILGDITKSEGLKQTIESIEPDVIVNLAALHFIPFCENHPKETVEINVTGTINILESLKYLKKRPQFVFASTVAVYKNSHKVLKEDSDVDPSTVYGRSKMMAERKIKSLCEFLGITYCILRFSNVYGKGDLNNHLIPEILNAINKKEEITLGNVNTLRDFIYIKDLCRALATVINQKVTGTYNVCSNKSYSAKDIVKLISEISKQNLSIKVLPDKIRRNDNPVVLCSNLKFSLKTGWKPRYSIRDGITETIT